jgi:putative ABC transport system permease protein
VGIDPVHEADVSTLKELIRAGKFLPEVSGANGPDFALIGSLLARNLKVGIGDELTILGQGRDGSVAASILTVCGVYESGIDEFDRNSLHIPIKTFQAVYSMQDAVHEIIVNVDSLQDVPMVKKAIANGLKRGIKSLPKGKNFVVMDWDELVPGLTQAIRIDLTMGIIFWFLLVLVVAFSILNTFLMAIFERTREFGVMMAIGTTPQRLVKLVMYESNFMTIVGVGLGVLIGCGLTGIFQIYGIDMSGQSEILKQYGMSGRIYPRLSLITAFAGPVLVWIITIAVALYPALKIKGLKPVEAMTHV